MPRTSLAAPTRRSDAALCQDHLKVWKGLKAGLRSVSFEGPILGPFLSWLWGGLWLVAVSVEVRPLPQSQAARGLRFGVVRWGEDKMDCPLCKSRGGPLGAPVAVVS